MFGLGADAGREQLIIPRADVDLPIPGPGVVFINGPSGSGKSTLLRLIAGQCEARGVRVLNMREDSDHEIDRVDRAEGGGGSEDACVIDRIAPERPLAEALELLSRTGLGDAFVMLRRPRELSDGQRFRFRLAQLLAAATTAPTAATNTDVHTSNPSPHAAICNKTCLCKNMSQHDTMNGSPLPAMRGGLPAPAATDARDTSGNSGTETRAIPSGSDAHAQPRRQPVAIFIDEFAATLDRITAHTLAANIRRWSDRTGVTFIIATTHDDLLDALQPDVLIHKPLGAAMEVIHARRASPTDASGDGDETASESAHLPNHQSGKPSVSKAADESIIQATVEAKGDTTSDSSARIARTATADRSHAHAPFNARIRVSQFLDTHSKSRTTKTGETALAMAHAMASRIAAATTTFRAHLSGDHAQRVDRTVDDHFRIQPGTIDDYRALAHFHYRSTHPGTATSVLRIISHKPTVVGAYLQRRDETTRVGVLVRSLPALACRLRDVATADRYAHLTQHERGVALNREVRCISRVIIDPRFRGLGLAVRLVQHAVAHPEDDHVLFTEALAAMGRVSPFFDRAGMRRFDLPVACRTAHARLLDALASLGLSPHDLIMSHDLISSNNLVASNGGITLHKPVTTAALFRFNAKNRNSGETLCFAADACRSEHDSDHHAACRDSIPPPGHDDESFHRAPTLPNAMDAVSDSPAHDNSASLQHHAARDPASSRPLSPRDSSFRTRTSTNRALLLREVRRFLQHTRRLNRSQLAAMAEPQLLREAHQRLMLQPVYYFFQHPPKMSDAALGAPRVTAPATLTAPSRAPVPTTSHATSLANPRPVPGTESPGLAL